jgi:ATP-dependent helicase/nuclease subunit B
LERLELPESSGGPSAAEFGRLGHEILRCCYQYLIDTAYFENKARDLDIQAIVGEIARGVFTRYEQDHPLGYPLAWEATKERLVELTRQVFADDLEELAQSGYVPVSLELESVAPFSAPWAEPLGQMHVRGRMDRVDEHAAANRLRIIDYKFKFSAQQAAEEKDLYRSALRGQKLQPFFYCLLGRHSGRGTPGSDPGIEAMFYYVASRWRGGPLVRAGFDGEALCGKRGAELHRTVARLATGIRDGEFFLQRSDGCAYCEVSEICRKNHPPSLWRSENDPRAAAHRELQNQEPVKP